MLESVLGSPQLLALLESRERKEGGGERGLVSSPVHACLPSQTSVSWGRRPCVWEVHGSGLAGAVLLQPALGTAGLLAAPSLCSGGS